jgi:hypothetical protein
MQAVFAVSPSNVHRNRIAPTFRGFVIALLLAVQALVFIELPWHTHRIALLLISDPAFAAHECGANERHIPLSELHSCPLCQVTYLRQYLPASTEVHAGLLVPVCDVLTETIAPLPLREFLLPSKRGPPALS